MDIKEEVSNYLNSQSPEIRDSVSVVSPGEIVGGKLLHISLDPNIKEFKPIVPRRSSPIEDITIPRVCVAPTVIGCMISYCKCLEDFYNAEDGWYIYNLNYELAVKPNNKAGDDRRTGEHWLIPYKTERWSYTADVIGKIFFKSVRFERVEKKRNLDVKKDPNCRPVKTIVDCFVEIAPGYKVSWSKAIQLEEGYHHLQLDLPDSMELAQWNKHKHYSVNKITEEEFMESKKAAASLLSIEEPDHLPKVGDYIELEDDIVVDNGPWTSKVTEIDGDKYTVEYNNGDEPYTIPNESFYDSKVQDSGDRICFAKQPVVSKESFPPSSNW